MTVAEDVRVLLRSLRGVWDEDAVDEFDHALQAAAHAMADDADDELVLAAALHDLAHSPLLADDTRGHDRVAYDWLLSRFGARVAWLAGAHVAAKRYLAASDADYAQRLSAVSVHSLGHQGGPGVEVAFVGHPWWPDALRLRRFDDAAKDPCGAPAPLEAVLAVAERVRRRR